MSAGKLWSTEEVDPGRCRRMADQLRELGAVLTAYTAADPHWAGLSGSRAQAERLAARQDGGTALEVAYSAALTLTHLNTFSILGHLGATATLLETESPPAPSIMVLSRSVLELSARTWWLADPAIGMASRVSRGYLEKLYSAHQDELFLAASRHKVRATGPVAEIEAEIKALPLDVDSRRWSLRVGDATRPNMVDLLRDFPGDDLADPRDRYYRLFSAPAHGTVFGVTLLLSAPPPEEKGTTFASYQLTQAWLDTPVVTGLLACCWAVQRVARLTGWDEQPLEELLRSADDLYG